MLVLYHIISSSCIDFVEGLLRNLGGMGNPQLYQVTRVGTKQLIEEYIDEVVKQLHYISSICVNRFRDEFDSFPNM